MSFCWKKAGISMPATGRSAFASCAWKQRNFATKSRRCTPRASNCGSRSAYQQADETRWLVFVESEGKKGHRWWLWVFNGEDTVVYVLDPRRSHDVPQGHWTGLTRFVEDARIPMDNNAS